MLTKTAFYCWVYETQRDVFLEGCGSACCVLRLWGQLTF